MTPRISKMILCTLLLALLCAPALAAEAPQPYEFPYEEGILFEAIILPNDDLLIRGSFAQQDPDGNFTDTIARITPAGEVVWDYHLPAIQAEAGVTQGQLPIDESGHFIVLYGWADSPTAYQFDVERGLVDSWPMPLEEGYITAQGDGYIFMNRLADGSGVRLRWVDARGKELRREEYPLEKADTVALHLINDGESLFLLGQHYISQDAVSTLMKLTPDGLLQWKLTSHEPHGFGDTIASDGQGGVLLLGLGDTDPVTGVYGYQARRIDGMGIFEWAKPIASQGWNVRVEPSEDGQLHMVWETDTLFMQVALDADGEVRPGPVYEKLNALHPQDNCWVAGAATDGQGRQWVYCNIIYEIDDYTVQTRPIMQPLEMYPLAEGGK